MSCILRNTQFYSCRWWTENGYAPVRVLSSIAVGAALLLTLNCAISTSSPLHTQGNIFGRRLLGGRHC